MDSSASLALVLRSSYPRSCSSESPSVLWSSDPSAHHLSELPLCVSCSSQLDCNSSEFRCYHPGRLVELMSRSTSRIKPAAGGAVGRGRRTQPPAFLPTNLSIDPSWLANHYGIICHPQVQGYLTHGGRQYLINNLSGWPGSGS